MNTTQLRDLVVLSEELSYRKTAEKLFISEQTLSASIKRLEGELGCALLERRPALRLTPAGESAVRHAREILRVCRHLDGELADLGERASGTLAVGSALRLATSLLPRIWEEFHSRFPEIRLSLTENRNQPLDELLRKGEIDLYLSFNAPRRGDTYVLTLGTERCCIVFSAGYLETLPEEKRQILLAPAFDLCRAEDFPLLLPSRGNGLREDVELFFMDHALRPEVIFESRRSQLIYRLCQRGAGVGLVYRMAMPEADDGAPLSGLYVRPLKNAIPHRQANLVYRKETVMPKYMRAFIDIAQRVIGEYADQSRSALDGME